MSADAIKTFRSRVTREFAAYFLVSVVALVVDMSVLLLLARFIHYTIAASISFLLGALIHYRLSIRMVFGHRKLEQRKMIEFSVFLVAGLIGLAVSLATIAICIEYFDVSLPFAKLVAAACSFATGYLVRKIVLF